MEEDNGDDGGLVDDAANRKTSEMSESLAELEKSAASKALEEPKTVSATL